MYLWSSDRSFKPNLSCSECNWPLNRESHLADCKDPLTNLTLVPLYREHLSLLSTCMYACGLINSISSHFVFIFTQLSFFLLYLPKKNLSKLIKSVSLGTDPSIFPTPNWIDLGGPHLAFSIGAICARFSYFWINMKKKVTARAAAARRHTTRVPSRGPRAPIQLCNLITQLSLQLIVSHIRARRSIVDLWMIYWFLKTGFSLINHFLIFSLSLFFFFFFFLPWS